MIQIIDITKYTEAKKKAVEAVKLDAQASYAAMEQCIKTLEMNNMPELRAVKAMIRKTMKEMVDIGKHGR